MKTTMKYLLCCMLPLGVAQAQEEPSPDVAAPPSSLELSGERTTGERIAFLLDVAQAHVTEKDYDAAIGAYERILGIDPSNMQARYVIAHIYINAKQYKKAEDMLQALIKEAPEDFKLWNNLAWLYATADDMAFRNGTKAVVCAHEAMTLAPDDYHVWSTLSEAYYVSGDYEKAYRAITHMAALAARYAKDITKESVEEYNEQIRKCKRAVDTAKMLKGEEVEE